MNSSERTLRAVRTLVQFDLAQRGADVAQAAALCAGAKREMNAVTQRCNSAMREMRSVQERSAIDPALFAAVHALLSIERHELRESQTRLVELTEREQQARAALADVRNRDRSVERALQAEQREQRLEQQVQDILRADDMWLQRRQEDVS